jgi:hypothetical protein
MVINPIVMFLHDSLDKSNSTIYLLEKYKKRSEWFKKEELRNIYQDATKSYEDLFENDLRLFLFDQGVEYPFSTPKSTSGRADIISNLDTSEPLVVEIKIFDRTKKYGKDRIADGFSQIVQYTNDYNKNEGYLVIYNLDTAELNFKFIDNNQFFPPMYIFNGKRYYFIVINLGQTKSASKLGKSETIEITEKDLYN